MKEGLKVVCSHCHQEVPEGNFCDQCGTDLNPESMEKCFACEGKFHRFPGQRYCQACGVALLTK